MSNPITDAVAIAMFAVGCALAPWALWFRGMEILLEEAKNRRR